MNNKKLNEVLAHLKKDERVAVLIEKLPKPTFVIGDITPSVVFESLVRSIVFQQLSGKAAGTILGRFRELFTDKTPTQEKILKLSDEKFKAVGLSGQKMGYLRDLSAKFLDGTIDPTNFHTMSDEEIREHLIAVKGIGRWTADMFLMFTLHRPDVLPTGDLAIQKVFQKVFNLRSLPDAKKMEKLSKDWRPYRTIACHYLWRSIDDSDQW